MCHLQIDQQVNEVAIVRGLLKLESNIANVTLSVIASLNIISEMFSTLFCLGFTLRVRQENTACTAETLVHSRSSRLGTHQHINTPFSQRTL